MEHPANDDGKRHAMRSSMKKSKQTKSKGIDITHAPASELLKLGFKPALVREIIAARQNIIVLVEGRPIEISQELLAVLAKTADESDCSVPELIADIAGNEVAR